MRYPGYFLNPGDMFQVLPKRVMYALGQPKPIVDKADGEEAEEVQDEAEEAEAEVQAEEAEPEIDLERDPKAVLKDLMSQAKNILADDKDIGGKRKQDLRAFSKAVRKMLSRSGLETVMTDSLEAQFQEIQNQLRIRTESKDPRKSSTPSQNASSRSQPSSQPPPSNLPEGTNFLSATDLDIFYSALRAIQLSDTTTSSPTQKPYAVPWMPRDFLSAFAFIPRYLEVNQNICAAVYVRHPVARPGLAEVPTPFPEEINANAFAWYLRRR
jgi:ribosomal protein S4